MSLGNIRFSFSKGERVYVDAVFVIASYVPGANLKREADRMWTKLSTENAIVCISTLVLDEMWYKALQRFYERDHPGVDFPKNDSSIPKQYCAELEAMTQKLLSLPNVQLLPVPTPVDAIVQDALSLVCDFSFYPRDAYHIAIARSHQIKYAISNDRHWRANIGSPIVLRFGT